MKTADYDLAVIGAGSGGIGAALAAGRKGLRTLLLEIQHIIGGAAVNSMVNVWEPGIGGTGIPFDIYKEMRKIPGSTGIYSFGRHICWPDSNNPYFPGGELLLDPEREYADSLRRYGSRGIVLDEASIRRMRHGVVFEPEAYRTAVNAMMNKTGRIDLHTGTSFTSVSVKNGRAVSAVLTDGTEVRSRFWIDGTNTGAFCRSCGVPVLPREDRLLNAVTLMYRITPCSSPAIENTPEPLPAECWWRDSYPLINCVQFPNGDRLCNMLPTMEGPEYVTLPEEEAYRECRRRVFAHWNWLQREYPEFRSYKLKSIASRAGVRETVHIKCEYMLSESDLIDGVPKQKAPDIIAIADHAMDRHGKGGGCRELDNPFGIPFHSLIPEGLRNVLISSMASGFTPEAATSCRLSRTMMQIGQAAGTAAALAADADSAFQDVPAGVLRKLLKEQHVTL